MQILQGTKSKKIDPYGIFRLLTSKKSRFSVNPHDFNLEKLVSYEDLQKFIVAVNPYFDFTRQDKLEYYRNYYIISHDIFDFCVKLIEESEKVAYYKIKDLDKNKFMTFNQLDDVRGKDKISHAIYEDFSEVKNRLASFLKLYKYLQIEKNVEIQAFNSQDIILEAIKL